MNQLKRLKPLFHPGRLLVTSPAVAQLRTNDIPIASVILRHVCGDWGIVTDDDREQNDLSLALGLRLLSIYRLPDGAKVWCVTEWDRSRTTICCSETSETGTSGSHRTTASKSWISGESAFRRAARRPPKLGIDHCGLA